ncbi:cyclase family protein [Streptomyces antibioticus]|uniref:cyclase family protein n=1 Tax=Streptomyces antibioticus TaxID=1890 RepID=UPI0036A16ECB
MAARASGHKPPRLTTAEFDTLYQRLASSTSWAAGELGALVALTPRRVAEAAREIRSGTTVTLAAPVETSTGPDSPEPAQHTMRSWSDGRDSQGLHFARDSFAMNVHGDTDSHLDALCHVIYRGTLHGSVSASSVTQSGARALAVGALANGIVGRGVLLDIPRLHGVPWLEPGEHVRADDLRAAEESQRTRVGEGDLLFVRVGHRKRRAEEGPWRTAEARAGLHPDALGFLAERRVAVLGGDGNNDTAPSPVDGVDFPVHVLAMHAMGLHLLDYLQFEDLVPVCAAEGRWSFFCAVAPLRLPVATGSPVNPIAIM